MAPIPATAAEGVVRTGWLYKCGHNVKGWKLRYFVLDQNELRYYKKDKDKKPAGVIRVRKRKFGVLEAPFGNKESVMFVQNPTRRYYLWSDNRKTSLDWLKALIQVEGVPYHIADLQRSFDDDFGFPNAKDILFRAEFEDDEVVPTCAFVDVERAGWLQKTGNLHSRGSGGWKKRFFVLTGTKLFYYKTNTETRQLGVIDLSDKVVGKKADRFKKKSAPFYVVKRNAGKKDRIWWFNAKDKLEQAEWMGSIRVNIEASQSDRDQLRSIVENTDMLPITSTSTSTAAADADADADDGDGAGPSGSVVAVAADPGAGLPPAVRPPAYADGEPSGGPALGEQSQQSQQSPPMTSTGAFGATATGRTPGASRYETLPPPPPPDDEETADEFDANIQAISLPPPAIGLLKTTGGGGDGFSFVDRMLDGSEVDEDLAAQLGLNDPIFDDFSTMVPPRFDDLGGGGGGGGGEDSGYGSGVDSGCSGIETGGMTPGAEDDDDSADGGGASSFGFGGAEPPGGAGYRDRKPMGVMIDPGASARQNGSGSSNFSLNTARETGAVLDSLFGNVPVDFAAVNRLEVGSGEDSAPGYGGNMTPITQAEVENETALLLASVASGSPLAAAGTRTSTFASAQRMEIQYDDGTGHIGSIADLPPPEPGVTLSRPVRAGNGRAAIASNAYDSVVVGGTGGGGSANHLAVPVDDDMGWNEPSIENYTDDDDDEDDEYPSLPNDNEIAAYEQAQRNRDATLPADTSMARPARGSTNGMPGQKHNGGGGGSSGGGGKTGSGRFGSGKNAGMGANGLLSYASPSVKNERPEIRNIKNAAGVGGGGVGGGGGGSGAGGGLRGSSNLGGGASNFSSLDLDSDDSFDDLVAQLL